MSQLVDVLIITAVPDEYDEALKVDDGALDSWEKKPGPTGLEVAFRTYQTANGGRMRVALTRALDMRGVATAAASTPLIAAYKPRCLAMCGVCAGRRGEVNLGDVVVGDILYTYDTGAIIAEYDEKGNRQERFKGEPSPYRISAIWKQKAESFSITGMPPWLNSRPRSLHDQGLWLMERLHAGDTEPAKHADRKTMCRDWGKVIDRLRTKGLLADKGIALTAAGREYISEIIVHNPDGLPAPPDFRVHVAPIATGNNVVRDEKIFERLSSSMRKVLAVEMEAAAIGAVAHITNIPYMIVMKAVMDHADSDKEDGFKPFAARASAECLIAFLRANVPDAPSMPEGRIYLPPAGDKGVVPISRSWTSWAQATRPPIPAKLLIAGRQAVLKQLLDWIQQEPSVLALQADTQGEAVAFLFGAIWQLKETERHSLLNRSYVIEDIDAWRRLIVSDQPLLLIPTFSDRTPIGEAVTHGHHVALPIGMSEAAQGPTLKLGRIGQAEAAKALQDSGLAENLARDFAKLARGGLGALRRKLAIHPASLLPAWAASKFARVLLPAILAGAWEDRRTSDQEILAKLAGRPYTDVRENLIYWANQPDPPVRLVADTAWTVVSAEDAWSLITPYLTTAEFRRFEEAFLEVIGEIDPALELPREQRWLAAMHNKVRKYSQNLRQGMTDSLAILAAQSEHAEPGPNNVGKEWADRIASQLFARCVSWQAWASLCDQLPLLAEAAPEPFIAAVDNDLSSDDPLLTKLFDDKIDPLLYHSPHTGLLWALETLAWSPQYLSEAAVALARLARLDPGGRMSNRPSESLREIFLLWHPSTLAGLHRRLQVLRTVQIREPEVGWRLLSRLLPDHGIATSTYQPRRRDWVENAGIKVTYAEIDHGTTEIVQRLINSAGTEGSRWAALINALERLMPNNHEHIIDSLENIDLTTISDRDRLQIWAALRHQLARHFQFTDQEWALPQVEVAKLQRLYNRFEPEDYAHKFSWLFSSPVELPIPGKRDWRERDEAVAKARSETAKDVFDAHGLDGIRALANQVEQPGALGFSLGAISIPCQVETEFLNSVLGSSISALRTAGRGYIIGRASRDDGQQWLQALRTAPEWRAWSARQKADYYLCCSFSRETWDTLAGEDAEIQKLYWVETSIWGRGQVAVPDCERAVEALSKYGRLVSAVEIIGLYGNQDEAKIDPNNAISVLEAIGRGESVEPINQGQFSYSVAELIQKLGNDEDADKTRVARLEWIFLPWLRDHWQARILNETLRERPDFFVEALELIYRAEGEPPVEVSDERRAHAKLGSQLLDEWDRPPGLSDDGQLDGQKLRDWVTRVRELASAGGRGKVADYRIGEILAHLPKGADGIWPHEVARKILEEVGGNERIRQGIISRTHSNRGVTRRAIGEGGQQERSIAKQYRDYAEVLTDSYPRIARLLRELASSYESEARSFDIRAELDELRWG